MTWAVLIAAEPRLGDLGMEAVDEHLRVSGPFCANTAWYGRGGYKGRLAVLVGWERHRPLIHHAAEAMGIAGPADVARVFNMKELLEEVDRIEPLEKLAYAIDNAAGHGFLWTAEAYTVAYQRVYRSLPDCRDCAC